MVQSGCSILLNTWQLLVVTELAPAHHSRENIQRSLTTCRFTLMPLFRRFLGFAVLDRLTLPSKQGDFHHLFHKKVPCKLCMYLNLNFLPKD
uniref:Secreted protein n=1 Tax=Xiphophorus couchianus TaxID=32473 RepID=A0A3B5MJ10_9TELE